jgi:hypothetical protein
MRSRRSFAIAALAAVCTVGLVGGPASAGTSGPDAPDKPPAKVKASALFVVNSTGGTASAAEGKTFSLSLTGVDPDALFFTDRPARDTGVISVDRMLALLADSDEGSPNGVVEVFGGEQGPVALAVELDDPAYDATTGTLTYEARTLKRTKGSRLDHYDDRLATELPATFDRAALFIDSSPFGSTNFCQTQVQNYTEQNVTLTDQFKWSSDTWDPAPPGNGFVLGLGDTRSWQSDGGFARGCGNSTTWQQDDGTTFHTSLTDPYGGDPNSISCTSSDPNGHPCHLDPNSTTRGASIDVIFYFCDNARQSGCPGQ